MQLAVVTLQLKLVVQLMVKALCCGADLWCSSSFSQDKQLGLASRQALLTKQCGTLCQLCEQQKFAPEKCISFTDSLFMMLLTLRLYRGQCHTNTF